MPWQMGIRYLRTPHLGALVLSRVSADAEAQLPTTAKEAQNSSSRKLSRPAFWWRILLALNYSRVLALVK